MSRTKSGVKEDVRQLTGAERAAIVMLSLGEEHSAKVWQLMDEDEIKEVSQVMSSLGTVSSALIEKLLVDFVSQMTGTGSLMGSYESTERLLARMMPGDKVGAIMEEIRGPAGRTMWDKLANVNETVLANYLKNEYPQTVSVVLSKIKPEHAARGARRPAGRIRAGSRAAHAAHGIGAQGHSRQGRADAAHRVHVEPGAHRQARRP